MTATGRLDRGLDETNTYAVLGTGFKTVLASRLEAKYKINRLKRILLKKQRGPEIEIDTSRDCLDEYN